MNSIKYKFISKYYECFDSMIKFFCFSEVGANIVAYFFIWILSIFAKKNFEKVLLSVNIILNIINFTILFCYYGKLDKILKKLNQNKKNNQNNIGCIKIIKEIICNLLPSLYWTFCCDHSSLIPSIIYLKHKYYELIICL